METSAALLLTTSWLLLLVLKKAPEMENEPLLVQSEPGPVTSAELLLLAVRKPRLPLKSSSNAPLLTTRRLDAPLLPTKSEPPMRQRAVELMSRTSLDLAVELRPIVPLSELVSSAWSESTSRVNEPLVPMVTLPVMWLVTLLNVLVAPSLTIWARRGGATNTLSNVTNTITGNV